ncbi:putative ubiquinone biosynthesis monooxygenase [Exophiala dermatitidis]|uniref:Ubiquinone biosynthesis monooxygenase COQ6, mitochondrial n=2 Tax=Exophiala dermatitidis TaxID=5970 RepID=H6C791_EXODN|nr:ubiquinone biosynthesis monooxygenase Coq6 [Exophiala dermatitidis NIH/UT8656]KAJ4522650.1 putative ubiquinone biosynthesis monooxygenase [Exophiala dermatitidis]EHY59587.1 ubiquinone biosynthesis monooxygenase Coq6 [Exophiala dermatitidis NIH/UT8656]KAJ4525951.1 putative ubiquinone biosynthesis monooxygenase [Exophiala dermatitidis]KAJ4527102.1 putative ubiquinone biosynthesis monooxygenase [Exophiala dermatitidis]KAJ4532820.1 putative ubiquinone biosynthesis monooxygenase [Exophiala derma
MPANLHLLPVTTRRVAAPTSICAQCRIALSSLNPSKRRRFSSAPPFGLASTSSSPSSSSSTSGASTSPSTTSTPEIYDVVTVGGGPAGLALLAALKSSPITSHLKTALIETQDLAKVRQWSLPSDKFANRASSLTPSSVSFLEQTGSWRHVDQTRIQPYDEMQVWDAANDAAMQFDWRAEARRYNAPPQTVATMVENANLTKGLLERIFELGAELSLLSNTSVAGMTMGKDDPDGFNLSTWPVLNLESKENTNAGPNSSSPPSSIAARLLVGADGFNSPVRKFSAIDSQGWDYNRHGVVATLTVQPIDGESHSHDHETELTLDQLLSDDLEAPSNRATAYQRFLPQLGGPIAILPLPNNRASMVWSTTPQNAAYLKQLDPLGQVSMINAALRLSQVDIKYMFTLPTTSNDSASPHDSELRWRLQHTSPPSLSRQPPIVTGVQEGSLASFPLRFRHASRLINPRVALVGDAAHTVHPLAGQGLNLGLADAKSLADTIAYAVTHGMDLGDLMTLERYGRDRFGKGLLMAGGVDALNSVYQLDNNYVLSGGESGDGILSTVLGQIRGLGMKVVDSGVVPGLKNLIMKQAN